MGTSHGAHVELAPSPNQQNAKVPETNTDFHPTDPVIDSILFQQDYISSRLFIPFGVLFFHAARESCSNVYIFELST